MDKMVMPATEIPSFNVTKALESGKDNHWLFKVWGGLGDQVCAEPTIRWAKKNVPWKRFGIAGDVPCLFEHYDCELYNLNEKKWGGGWYECWTIKNPNSLSWEFFSHAVMHPVDYTSILCLRRQIPNKDKEIQLPDYSLEHLNPYLFQELKTHEKTVVVHPGKHWESKTFPAEWWNDVLKRLKNSGITPVLIGKDNGDGRGYVDVDSSGCIDLRDMQSIKELIALLKGSTVLLSNDSAPIHIAAAGDAHIVTMATCKHPDFLAHWRRGKWAWRFHNLTTLGLWDYKYYNLFIAEEDRIDSMEKELKYKILPKPQEVSQYCDELLKA